MLLEIASLLFPSLLLQLWLVIGVIISIIALFTSLLNLRFFYVFLVFLCILVACEVADKQRPGLLLCLLFGPLDDPLSLILSSFVLLHIFPILVALEVL